MTVEPLALDPSFALDPKIAAPTPTSQDLTAISFEARRSGDDVALAACFSAPLPHGFSREEVAPLAVDALRDVGVRRLGLADVANGALADVGPVIRRVDSARAATGRTAVIVSELGFTRGGDLVACVSGCTNEAACGSAIRAPRLAGDLAAAPLPGLALSAVLAGVSHPEGAAALGLAAALALSVLAVHFRRYS